MARSSSASREVLAPSSSFRGEGTIICYTGAVRTARASCERIAIDLNIMNYVFCCLQAITLFNSTGLAAAFKLAAGETIAVSQ